jgi:hypothetical protein
VQHVIKEKRKGKRREEFAAWRLEKRHGVSPTAREGKIFG